MSINIIRRVSRLSLTRGGIISLLSHSTWRKSHKILYEYNEIPKIATLKCRFYCSKSDNDMSKFATYDQIKDLPNHPEKLLIDVREPHELAETGVIPTSINIPLNIVSEELKLSSVDFVQKYKRLKPEPHTEIIFTCRSGKRAQDACNMASQLGFKIVKNYKGSWTEWAEKEKLNK